MICFTANACGRRLPLLTITLQGYTSFRHFPFHSVHCQSPASATHARVSPSFHCAHDILSFHSAPLWLFHPQPGTQIQNRKLHSTQPTSLHYIQSIPLLFPTQSAICPVVVFTPENQKPQNSPPPFNGAGKIKELWRMAFVLAAGSSHSFNRSLGRSFLATPLTFSFRSPHQLQHRTCKCFVPQHPHLSRPQFQHSHLFYLRIVCPKNPFPIVVALFNLH
jgi:hypothetical protein